MRARRLQVFPTLVGRPKSRLGSKQLKGWYVGDEAAAKRAELRLERPIEHGVVANWEVSHLTHKTM